MQCLTPVLALNGWKITTVEGLGDKYSGYHPIQVNTLFNTYTLNLKNKSKSYYIFNFHRISLQQRVAASVATVLLVW